MKTKKRFVCPKHNTQCRVMFNKNGGGRFHGCMECWNVGDKFTVMGSEPYTAYGNIAEEYGQAGVPQIIQTFPTLIEERKMTLKNEYISFLNSITPAEESDFRLFKLAIEEFVHPLGGKYRKITINDARYDLERIRKGEKL